MKNDENLFNQCDMKMKKFNLNIKHLLYIYFFVSFSDSKYIEGEIKTSEDWAFLTRFCFLSEQGTFEFYFEFKADQGYPNLLLYYDAPDQWTAVYKSDKTCREKENVLHINQNQIVNLTLPKSPLDDLAGCTIHIKEDISKDKTTPKTTSKPKKTVTTPVKLTTKKPNTTPMTTTMVNEFSTMENEENSTIFTTQTENFYEIDYNTTDFDDIYDIENLFGENIYSNDNESIISEDVKPKEKRSVPIKSPNYNTLNAIITCRNARKFRSTRARWWFIAVSNCGGNKGIHIKYQVLMTNGRPGDYWHEHFSADEFYVLPVLMAFSIAYGMLLFAIIICSVELKSRQLLHATYKIFVLSVILQLLGIGLTSMVYLKYAVNGVLPYKTKVLGGMFMGGCESLFLLLLLLLAKGYTTTRGRLPLSASVKLTMFMCLYVITFLCLFIYEAKVFDPGEVLYLYESPAGYGLIVLRIVAWWIFIYSTVFTLKHYPEKSNFYYPFNICGTLWFVAGPAFILSANSYVDKWVRESVVCGVLLFITFAGHLMFLILTLPAMANKNFPYHIRTTQIGVMEVHGVVGAGTLDQFNHHSYQPSAPLEQTVIIPLHSNTEDIFTAGYRKRIYEEDRETSDDENSEDGRKRENRENIDNVLKWSTVKESVNSRTDGGTSQTEMPTANLENGEYEKTCINSPGKMFRAKNIQKNDSSLAEWTRDVPLELFTVSKMVINKPNT